MADSSQPDASPQNLNEPPDPLRPASATPAAIDPRTSAASTKTVHDPYAAFRQPGFFVFECGFVVNVIGQQAQSIAVDWEVFQRTHSALALGWIGFAQALPLILLALPAGHVADRFDRRRIVVAMAAMSAVFSVVLLLLSHYHGQFTTVHWLFGMYTTLFAAAIANALATPARNALLPQIVPVETFANAVAWNSSIYQIAAVVGPALGGVVIIWRQWPAYAISAIAAVVFAIATMSVQRHKVSQQREPATLKSLVAGIHFVARTRIILATITLDLFAVLLGGATFLLPIFATDILHVGSWGFGVLRAAPAVGAVAMATVVTHLPPFKKAGRAMLWAVAGFGAATLVFGISHNFWLSLAMLFLTGAFDNISVLVRHTLVQVLTPDAMRGRVSAVNNVFIGSSNELGGWESGVTAHLLGPVGSVILGGVGTIVVVVLTAFVFPQVLSFGSLQEAHTTRVESETATTA